MDIIPDMVMVITAILAMVTEITTVITATTHTILPIHHTVLIILQPHTILHIQVMEAVTTVTVTLLTMADTLEIVTVMDMETMVMDTETTDIILVDGMEVSLLAGNA